MPCSATTEATGTPSSLVSNGGHTCIISRISGAGTSPAPAQSSEAPEAHSSLIFTVTTIDPCAIDSSLM